MGNKWPGVLDQIHASKKQVTVLPVDEAVRQEIRETCGIGRSTILGTVLHNAGGIVIDGWIRIYGAGALNFAARNRALGLENTVVAEDVIGGLFAGMEDGTVGYFSPATLGWEPMHLSYPQFLDWCLRGNSKVFYGMQQWKGWEEDVKKLDYDSAFAFTPELWRLGSPVDERERRVVPAVELTRTLLATREERKNRAQK